MGLETIFLLLTAFVVVLLTSLFKSEMFSKRVKHLVATALSVVAAVGFAYFNGDLQLDQDFLTIVTSMYGSSQLIYQFMVRDTKLDYKLERTLVRPKEVY